MSITFTRRMRVTLLALLTALLAIAGVVAPSAAQAAVVSAGASTAHPYSDPVWWPLANASAMGCYRGNPGCPGDHSGYIFDIVGQYGVNNQPVFAMGAGIVHIGATNQGCGHAQGRGNYLWVDHGNGVLTYYGHLGAMSVRNGQYVSPRTRLAYMGNSGYSRCHTFPKLRYVMIALKHGGTGGPYVEIPRTYVCPTNGRGKITYPNQLPRGAASHWNAVRNTTAIPAASASRSCITTPAQTATKPFGVGMARQGSSTMDVHWARPWSGYHVWSAIVVLSVYHPSIHRWSRLSARSLSASAADTRFYSLKHNYRYSAYVQFHNAAGYSAASTSAYASIGR